MVGGVVMTRDEARKAAEVMSAYAEGKEIEFSIKHKNIWYTHDGDTVSDGEKIIHTLEFNFEKFDYRIKSEPTYRPFKDKEECWNEMQKHQPFGWVLDRGSLPKALNLIYETGIKLGTVYYYFTELFKLVTFPDGTPFGIKEE